MRLPVRGRGRATRHYYKWPVVSSLVLAMLVLLLLEFPVAYRLGLGVGNEVRAHGTADVRLASCALSGAHLKLLYTCDADVRWDDPDHRTRDGQGTGPAEITTNRPVSGPVPVVEACRAAASACAILPADAPFRGRWWVLPSFVVPLLAALLLGAWITSRLPEPRRYRVDPETATD